MRVGRRGPKPEPTESKRARGNPGKRQLEEPINVGGRGMPKMPTSIHGNKPAQALWRGVGPMLVEAGILDKADGPAFAAWCSVQAEADKLGKRVAKLGNDVVIESNGGKTTQMHPLHAAWRAQVALAANLGSRFGLDPSSRTSLTGKTPTGAPTTETDPVGESPRHRNGLRSVDGGRSSAG